jgi:NADH:ubiquinone oxidoreductase subunit 3 (subunit A)
LIAAPSPFTDRQRAKRRRHFEGSSSANRIETQHDAVAFVTIALVPIVVGVLACMRYVWAMIVGTILWSSFFDLVVVSGGFSELPEHKFELTSIVVLVLLTVAAIAWRPCPATSGAVAASGWSRATCSW